MKCLSLTLVVLALLAVFPFQALGQAAYYQLGTEDSVNGFVGSMPFLGGAYGDVSPARVASDGEDAFDPFNVGYDVSDAIQFNSLLGDLGLTVFADNSNGAFDAGFWTQIDAYTWVLPANTPAGNENEPLYEPVAKWYVPGFQLPADYPREQWILEQDGSLGDLIIADNSGPDGSAALLFASDAGVPEPATIIIWSLLGAIGIAVAHMRRRKAA